MQHTLMTKNQEYIKNADKSVRKDKYNVKIGKKPGHFTEEETYGQ